MFVESILCNLKKILKTPPYTLRNLSLFMAGILGLAKSLHGLDDDSPDEHQIIFRMTIYLFIHVDGHLDCSQFEAITNKTAMNICLQVFQTIFWVNT